MGNGGFPKSTEMMPGFDFEKPKAGTQLDPAGFREKVVLNGRLRAVMGSDEGERGGGGHGGRG
jgi:hypothetical protein